MPLDRCVGLLAFSKNQSKLLLCFQSKSICQISKYSSNYVATPDSDKRNSGGVKHLIFTTSVFWLDTGFCIIFPCITSPSLNQMLLLVMNYGGHTDLWLFKVLKISDTLNRTLTPPIRRLRDRWGRGVRRMEALKGIWEGLQKCNLPSMTCLQPCSSNTSLS